MTNTAMNKISKNQRLNSRHTVSYIILFLFSLMIVIPILIALINAFKPRNEILYSPLSVNLSTLTFNNITETFHLMDYLQSLYHTALITVLSCLLMVMTGSMMGFSIGILQRKAFNAVYLITVLVITIPFVSIMIPVVITLSHLNLINTTFGTSIIHVATSLPVVVFLYTGFMRTVPRELCEAAVVDGCNMWRTYWQVYFPLMKNTTFTMLIIRGVGVWNDLIISRITITSSSRATLIYKLYTFVSNRFNRWDTVFAATLLTSLPIIITFILLQKHFSQGIMLGSVKG